MLNLIGRLSGLLLIIMLATLMLSCGADYYQYGDIRVSMERQGCEREGPSIYRQGW